MVEILSLEGPEALLLVNTHSLQVAARTPAEARLLEASGFVVAPAAIESFLRIPVDLAARPSRYRRTIRASLNAWDDAGLTLTLVPVRELGTARFLDEVYFPLFLRVMYTRGIAPHGADQLATMTALVESGKATTVALVHAGTELVGAALLGRLTQDARRVALHGELPTGSWEEGLVYALHERLQPCRRALMIKLAEALAATGARWFSLGRDAAWCEEGYDGVFFEKLHLADTVVAAFGERPELFSWAPAEHEHYMFFAWDELTRAVIPRNHGCAEERFAPIANALRAAPAGAAPPPPRRPSAAT